MVVIVYADCSTWFALFTLTQQDKVQQRNREYNEFLANQRSRTGVSNEHKNPATVDS